jgi:hypothetical protein
MRGRVAPPGAGSILPETAEPPLEIRRQVEHDYQRFAEQGLPEDHEAYLLDEYAIDVATTYAGIPVRNPWGKASGQLSMTAHQVEEDVAAELGFVVLKTVIAQDDSGSQSMSAWAVRESRMVPERITGATGEEGWTITWKGRGWWQSFNAYLELVRRAREIADRRNTLIVPSCKYHLPSPDETEWRSDEYRCTTARILDAWHGSECGSDFNCPAMPLEKDFSPTLAGSDLARAQPRIFEWLREVPRLVRDSDDRSVLVGLKLFNAMFSDDFQVDLLHSIHNAETANRPDFYIYGNRLFDPDREFDGHRGVAYGGPDLSDRNLRVLSAFHSERNNAEPHSDLIPWSATGDITTGRMAIEYALRGASTFQLHTYFQLPADQYRMKTGSRTQRALHELYFHPTTGFIVWADWLRRTCPSAGKVIRISDFTDGLPSVVSKAEQRTYASRGE